MATIQLLIDGKYGSQGNPNYFYYQLAAAEYGKSGDTSCYSNKSGGPDSSCVFYDITLGDDLLPCEGTYNCYTPKGDTYGILSATDSSLVEAYNSGVGYDLASGLGSINAGNLFSAWDLAQNGGTVIGLSLSASSVAQGVAINVAATLAYASASAPSSGISYTLDGGSAIHVACNANNTPETCPFTIATTSLAIGSHTIVASFAADGVNFASTATTTFTVTSNVTPSFTLSAASSDIAVAAGGQVSDVITIKAVNGFSGAVTFSVAGLPAGVSATFNPASATTTSTMTISATQSAAEGSLNIFITGTSGSLTAMVPVFLSVSTPQTFTVTDYYDFGNNGVLASSSIVQGIDGSYYGVASPISFNNGPVTGLIYKLDAANNYAFTSVASMDPTTVGLAGSTLAVGPDGTMYGVTSYRYFGQGDVDGGVFYSVTTGGTLTILHTFSKAEVYGAIQLLTLASDGNFYFTTADGGTNGIGAIVQVTPAGAATVLYSFDGTIGEGGGSGLAPIVQASDGNFYGGIPQDTEGQYGSIYKMVKSGSSYTVSSIHSMAYAEGYGPDSALVQGANGNLYGVTECGGTGTDVSCGDGTIFEVTTAGKLTKLWDFAAETAGFGGIPAFNLGSDGNFYGLNWETGNGNYFATFYQMTPEGVLTTPSESDSNSSKLGNGFYGEMLQAGDGSFLTTTGGSSYGDLLRLTVSPALHGPITLTASASPKAGSPFTLSYTVSNAFSLSMQQCYINAKGQPAGSGASALKATGTITSAGFTGSVQVTPTSSGSYTYVMTCGGNESGFATVAVGGSSKVATTTTVTVNPNPVEAGQNTTVVATVTGGSTPSGTVELIFNGTTLTSASLSNGKATFSVSDPVAGSYPMTAAYGGDAGHLASTSATFTVVISKATSTLTVSANAACLEVGQKITLNAQVKGAGATGKVSLSAEGLSFFNGPLVVRNPTLSSINSFSMSTTGIPTGFYNVLGSYPGDSNNDASTELLPVVVQPMLSSANPVSISDKVSGGNIVFTSAVGCSGAVPTGMVKFEVYGANINIEEAALVHGVAVTKPLSTAGYSGSYQIYASYLGDANYPAAVSKPITVTIP